MEDDVQHLIFGFGSLVNKRSRESTTKVHPFAAYWNCILGLT